MLKTLKYELGKTRTLWLMAAPAIIFFLIFSYLPMAGTVLAFKSFSFTDGIFGSPWNGIDNFRFFFASGDAFRVTRNTILYNLAFIVVNNSIQIMMALALTEITSKFFKRFAQSMMFLPYFISWVVVGGMLYSMINANQGMIVMFLHNFNITGLDIYGTPQMWPFIITIVNAWKWVGYGTVIYMAAIMGIDQEMYEASDIDGANVFQKMWYITIPCLIPTIVVLVLLSIGQIFRGDFGMFYQLTGNSGVLYQTTDVIDTYVIRSLLSGTDFGMAAAGGLYQSVLCFVILISVNFSIKKTNKEYALF